jgi:hypothetical protein
LVPFLYLHIHLGDTKDNFHYSMRVENSLKALFCGEESSLVRVEVYLGYLGLKKYFAVAVCGDGFL